MTVRVVTVRLPNNGMTIRVGVIPTNEDDRIMQAGQ